MSHDGRLVAHVEDWLGPASARTADAAGFPDQGWHVIGMFPGAPG